MTREEFLVMGILQIAQCFFTDEELAEIVMEVAEEIKEEKGEK